MNVRTGTGPAALLGSLWTKMKEDNVFNGAAALGFFLTLAIFPAMILVMSVIPYLPIMLVAASVGFALYVRNFGNYQAVYGGIGAVIVLMLWLYIAGLSLLVGAEINVLIERRAGR